jgi:hypothetical protein
MMGVPVLLLQATASADRDEQDTQLFIVGSGLKYPDLHVIVALTHKP